MINTRISSMTLIDTNTGSDADDSAIATTGLAPADHSSDCDIDLLTLDGGGKDTYANNVVLMFAGDATENNIATAVVYGAASYGPWEQICSIALTLGTGVAITDYNWYDTAVVTDTNLVPVVVADSGNNRVARVGFDATGLRYLKIVINGRTGDTPVKTYMRWF